ncbi:hypothetical protein NMG60_11019441 [Bertholletia excelsa]
MSSTEDQISPSNIFDPPSSPSQPLLSKHYTFLSPTADPTVSGDSTSDEPHQSHHLHISYNRGHRPVKDLPFLILFSLFVLCTFACGIFASFNRNPNSFCAKEPSPNSLSLYGSSSILFTSLIWTLLITLILSIPFVFLVLFSLKHFTRQLVYASLPLVTILLSFINVYWFVACTINSTCSEAFPVGYRILLLVSVFLIVAVIAWIIVVNRHRIPLTVRIIGVAAHALSRNLAYYVPIVLFLVFASQNGKILSQEKSGRYYCAWKQDSWVPAYYALAMLTMLWSATAMLEAKAFVISGTIAQWYFSKDQSTPRQSIRNSLRNAFGPSLGTVCFSGLLVCVIRMMRALIDSARQKDASGMVNATLRCCVNSVFSAVDFINKFTINFVAITGEAYCASARMTYELLTRNLLSVVFVETVSTRLLVAVIFVLSVVYAILVCVILNVISNLGVDSYSVAAMAWMLLLLVFGYFVHVLDNVIDTVYVCYAIDRDGGR